MKRSSEQLDRRRGKWQAHDESETGTRGEEHAYEQAEDARGTGFGGVHAAAAQQEVWEGEQGIFPHDPG